MTLAARNAGLEARTLVSFRYETVTTLGMQSGYELAPSTLEIQLCFNK